MGQSERLAKVIWTSDAPRRSTMRHATIFIYGRSQPLHESWKQLYSHTYTNWYYEAEASFNYKQFSLFWQINTNWNNFWGETLSGGENIQMLAVYYKHKNLRVGVGAFNPFTDNYKVQSENWNKFASYKTNNYIKESSRMFLVNFSYNFSFGRSFKTAQRKVNNSDNDSGVMGTGK